MAVSLKENNWFFITDQTPRPRKVRFTSEVDNGHPLSVSFPLLSFASEQNQTKLAPSSGKFFLSFELNNFPRDRVAEKRFISRLL
jgi:hypothetical protein